MYTSTSPNFFNHMPYLLEEVDVYILVTLDANDEKPEIAIFHHLDLAWRLITKGCTKVCDNQRIRIKTIVSFTFA